MKICKYDLLFVLIALCVLGVFTYFGWQDVDIQFLGFTSGDELPQFKQLNNVLEGYLSFDLEKMFRIEFYNYGYIYYLLNVFITAPFNLVEKYDWAIFAPRFLNGIFSILNLWMVYKIANLYLTKSRSLLLVIFCLLIPGFWHYGYIFKPDVFQAFFVLCSVYFLCLDNFVYKKNFYLSVLMLGLGIGVAKFQAIMFAPLLCAYVFIPFLNNPTLKNFWQGCWKSFIVVLCLLLIWVVTNPYLLHPTGARVWWNAFLLNMHSNATNHESYIDVTLLDKILMEAHYFLSPIIVIVIVVIMAMDTMKRKNPKNVWFCVFFSFFISMLYLLCFVNKAWGNYYISSIYLAVVLCIFLFVKNSKYIVVFLVLQGINILIFHSHPLFLKTKRDIATLEVEGQELIVNLPKIQNTLQDKKILLVGVGDFAYRQIGLNYKNLMKISGDFPSWMVCRRDFVEKYPYKNPNKYFTQYDLIVVRKNIYQNIKNAKTLEYLEDYGYFKIHESKNFVIYQYQGERNESH